MEPGTQARGAAETAINREQKPNTRASKTKESHPTVTSDAKPEDQFLSSVLMERIQHGEWAPSPSPLSPVRRACFPGPCLHVRQGPVMEGPRRHHWDRSHWSSCSGLIVRQKFKGRILVMERIGHCTQSLGNPQPTLFLSVELWLGTRRYGVGGVSLCNTWEGPCACSWVTSGLCAELCVYGWGCLPLVKDQRFERPLHPLRPGGQRGQGPSTARMGLA